MATTIMPLRGVHRLLNGLHLAMPALSSISPLSRNMNGQSHYDSSLRLYDSSASSASFASSAAKMSQTEKKWRQCGAKERFEAQKNRMRSQLENRDKRFFASSSSSSDDDTHNDFKPIDHPSPSDVRSTISKDVSENKVFVYMKGVPAAPMCGFSMTVCRILDFYGATYGSRNVLDDPDIRQGIKEFTSWPTIPQVFIDGEFVGGCDIMISMHEEGELASALGVQKES